jgi:hypothetical protein
VSEPAFHLVGRGSLLWLPDALPTKAPDWLADLPGWASVDISV